MDGGSSQCQLPLLADNVYYLLVVTYEVLWNKGYWVVWEKGSDAVMCGEVDTCMRDKGCTNLLVMIYQKHKTEHSVVVLSEEGKHKRLVLGNDVGVSWKDDLLGEVWALVVALRDEYVMVICVLVLNQLYVCAMERNMLGDVCACVVALKDER